MPSCTELKTDKTTSLSKILDLFSLSCMRLSSLSFTAIFACSSAETWLGDSNLLECLQINLLWFFLCFLIPIRRLRRIFVPFGYANQFLHLNRQKWQWSLLNLIACWSMRPNVKFLKVELFYQFLILYKMAYSDFPKNVWARLWSNGNSGKMTIFRL